MWMWVCYNKLEIFSSKLVDGVRVMITTLYLPVVNKIRKGESTFIYTTFLYNTFFLIKQQQKLIILIWKWLNKSR